MMLVANSKELATPGSGISGYETIWFTMKKNDCRPSSDKPRLASDIPFTSMDKMVAYCLWTKAHWRYLLPKWLAIVWSVVKFISLNYIFFALALPNGGFCFSGGSPNHGFRYQNGSKWSDLDDFGVPPHFRKPSNDTRFSEKSSTHQSIPCCSRGIRLLALLMPAAPGPSSILVSHREGWGTQFPRTGARLWAPSEMCCFILSRKVGEEEKDPRSWNLLECLKGRFP